MAAASIKGGRIPVPLGLGSLVAYRCLSTCILSVIFALLRSGFLQVESAVPGTPVGLDLAESAAQYSALRCKQPCGFGLAMIPWHLQKEWQVHQVKL